MNILIVDDEKLICESMKLKIEAIQSPEINEIYTAYSGLEALQFMEIHETDIVFTDIKMPKLTGIELLKVIHERYPQIKCIVLSGYDDYAYVREAFKLGALDYILKPASIEDLKEKLDIAINQIYEEQKQRESGQANLLQRETHIIKSHLLGLFLGSESVNSESQELEDILSHHKVVIAVLDIETEDEMSAYTQRRKLELLWNKEALKLKHEKDLMIYSFWIDDGRFIILYNFNDDAMYNKMYELFQAYLRLLKQNICTYAIMALSQVIEQKDELNHYYNQVLISLKYRLLYHPFSIISHELIDVKKMPKPILNKEQILMISSEDILENIKHALNLINSVFTHESLNDQSIESIEKAYDLINSRLRQMKEVLLYSQEGIINKELYDFKSIQSLKAYLMEQIFLIKKLAVYDSNRERTIGEIAKTYIKENYQKEIDMSVVANMVSVSYTYFSELFKKQTGMNFRKYIMKIRMEEAKKLLSDPTNKINEVAVSIGYENPKHFTRAFTNYYGMSPTDYKNELTRAFDEPK